MHAAAQTRLSRAALVSCQARVFYWKSSSDSQLREKRSSK